MPTALSDTQRRDWLRLMRSRNIGPVTFRRLVNRFGGASQALAGLEGLIARHGNRKTIEIAPIDRIDAELERGAELGCVLVSPTENGFPPLLRAIASAPPMLWTRGKRDVAARPAIAIVGSRQASAHGRQMARSLSHDLAEAGHVIVSGFAAGIDRAAHEGALTAGTLAAIAGGLGRITPDTNADLIEPLCETGLFVSERPPDAPPRATDFPARNRIIAGASALTVVIEAALKSGSLITARLAGEFGRPVAAVPGTPQDARSAGPNGLIKRGAALIETVDDVLTALKDHDMARGHQKSLFTETGDEADYTPDPDPAEIDVILSLLGADAVSPDVLVRESGLTARAVNAILVELEFSARIAIRNDGTIEKTVP